MNPILEIHHRNQEEVGLLLQMIKGNEACISMWERLIPYTKLWKDKTWKYRNNSNEKTKSLCIENWT